MYIYIYIHMCIYIYRERERLLEVLALDDVVVRRLLAVDGELQGGLLGLRYERLTPSPPIKSLDFSGFDSSRLLILRGGNYHVC